MKTHPTKFMAVASLGVLASSMAVAAACAPSSDPCTVDLGNATVTFGQGSGSYFADAMLTMGSDGSYGANTDLFSTFAIVHQSGGDGFSFAPQVYGAVGGSGMNGFHEVMGYFRFIDMTFAAKPGYQLDGVQMTVTGTQNFFGDASATVSVPVAAISNGSNFSFSGAIDASNAYLQADFIINASYLEGPNGTALSYGTASASFDSATFIARVSAVPEPSHWAMLGLGAGLILLRSRPRLA